MDSRPHIFKLDQAWASAGTETEIEIYSATSAAEFRHIQNLEVTFDLVSRVGLPTSMREFMSRDGGCTEILI